MGMRITRSLALAFLLLTGACAATPAERRSAEAPQTPLKGGIAEFRVISYDGSHLEGRILLGATVDTLVIDGDMLPDRNVEIKKARACGTTELREHYIVDFVGHSRPEDIITLRRGSWYGMDDYFLLWDKVTGLGPDCLEAELVVHALDGRIAATLPIRVVRTDKPVVVPPDGAAGEPKPPPADAGAP
jgi:hypothetical protein